ncbi:hypothetical protein [Bacillus yapensis]|uniref:hypothetical protein n=1 Tax=Bacillus yapensis TaxID=2492960 RepID=UPI001FEC438D|nr:hypothetical protein [Bacillus yapensis]
MAAINFELLEGLIQSPVEVSIQDDEGEERAPFVRIEIRKIEICPDQTHLRIYFDQRKFFAIPLESKVEIVGDTWTATDVCNKLTYVIRKVG